MVAFSVFKEKSMQVDWSLVIAKTDLKNQGCILEALTKLQVHTVTQLSNLPGRHPKPWICEVSTHEVVAKLYEAHKHVSDEIPVVDDVIVAVEKAEDKSPHYLEEMELPGVEKRHLKALAEAKIVTGEDVVQYESHLVEVPGIGEKTVGKIVDAVKTALDIKDIEKE
jgi:hypothetical protein